MMMSSYPIVFNDGQAYERAMGGWSQRAGKQFLDWLAPSPGARWLDIGCGNGAFTELVVQRCAPTEVHGVDSSEAQLAFARTRLGSRVASLVHGDAGSLPFGSDLFDIAVMALVIFFVPDPSSSLSEMRRVTRPHGTIAAYVWDTLNDASPMAPIEAELRVSGITIAQPPRVDISGLDALRQLWHEAGLESIESTTITVWRTFANFDEYWASVISNTSVAPLVAQMSENDAELLKMRASREL